MERTTCVNVLILQLYVWKDFFFLMVKTVYTAKVKACPSSFKTKSECLRSNQGQSKQDSVAEPAVTKRKVSSPEITNAGIRILE